MANAVLERTIDQVAREQGVAGWASGTAGGAGTVGPITRTDTMSIGGVASATGVLLAVVVVTGLWGWNQVQPTAESVTFPGWVLPVLLGAFALAIVTSLKPGIARFTAPLYAAAEGVVVGAVSRAFELQWNGIVVQAVLGTVVVFAAMLLLFASGAVRVTDRMRRTVILATVGVAGFYLVSILLSVFGVGVPLVWDSGPLGIGFSLVVIGIASFNLLLDFDLVERGAHAGLPKHMEWYCAFGLTVSLVWIYLEMLRLLAKLRN